MKTSDEILRAIHRAHTMAMSTNHYKCDDCPAIFTQEEVRASKGTPLRNGFEAPQARTYKNPDGVESYLTCPKCGKIHFFGFDLVEATLAPAQ